MKKVIWLIVLLMGIPSFLRAEGVIAEFGGGEYYGKPHYYIGISPYTKNWNTAILWEYEPEGIGNLIKGDSILRFTDFLYTGFGYSHNSIADWGQNRGYVVLGACASDKMNLGIGGYWWERNSLVYPEFQLRNENKFNIGNFEIKNILYIHLPFVTAEPNLDLDNVTFLRYPFGDFSLCYSHILMIISTLEKNLELKAKGWHRISLGCSFDMGKMREEAEKRKAEEEAKKRAEEEAKRKAEEEKKRAEEEKRRAAEEAKIRAEEEAKRKAEEEKKKIEEERLKAEEAKRKAEEEAKLLEEERRKLEEEKRKLEEQKKILAEKLKGAEVKETEKGLMINLKQAVNFKTGSAILTLLSTKVLDELITILKAYPQNKISIEGHTDITGKHTTNLKLSLARAQSVTNYLITHGIPRERIVSVIGYGPDKPIASNKTPAGRTANRRVEVIILK